MAQGLRERLIGAWKLLSYEERSLDGSAPSYPMTEQPMGMLLYTPDGYVSAQLMHPNRGPFASGDWFDATDEEYKAEASSYIAYAGKFHVDEENKTLTHSMFVSLFPNWLGQTQARVFKLEGDTLHLSTEGPIPSGGRLVHPHLRWRRADKV